MLQDFVGFAHTQVGVFPLSAIRVFSFLQESLLVEEVVVGLPEVVQANNPRGCLFLSLYTGQGRRECVDGFAWLCSGSAGGISAYDLLSMDKAALAFACVQHALIALREPSPLSRTTHSGGVSLLSSAGGFLMCPVPAQDVVGGGDDEQAAGCSVDGVDEDLVVDACLGLGCLGCR